MHRLILVGFFGLLLGFGGLEVAADTSHPAYNRAEWKHWVRVDGCQTSRVIALMRDSRQPVQFEDVNTRCRVAWGDWLDPYTGKVFHTAGPGQIDLDHMVPLKHAHDSGGADWSTQKKEEYANYLGFSGHLVTASASANRAKGDRGPAEWLPRDEHQCQYVKDWAVVKFVWGLRATEQERSVVKDVIERRCSK